MILDIVLCKYLMFLFLLYSVISANECQSLILLQIVFHFPGPKTPDG